MAIGSAQPSAAQLASVKHYFVDTFPVTQPLNAADFERLALGYLDEIFLTRNVAVVCGGTGLYVRALCDGLDEMPPVDPAIAQMINEHYEANGLDWLQDQLKQQDPAFLRGGDVANPARLLRALIFRRSSGKSILDFQSSVKKVRPFRIVKVGFDMPREELYRRINHRVELMMETGFLDEARKLFPLRHLKNLQTVGYTELFEHLAGNCTLEQAVSLIKQRTRNYAKRQLTWFRKDPEIEWLKPNDDGILETVLRRL